MWRGLAAGLAAGALIVAAVFVLVDRMAADQQAADRRALLARNAALSAQAISPGSALACIETAEALGKACELAVFSTAQSAAAASAFVAERLKVLAAAEALAKRGDNDVLAALGPERAALGRDRFGLTAQVLSRQYGCRPDHCDELAWLADPATVKAHLADKPFEALIADYRRLWDRPGEPAAPVASAPAEPVASAAASAPSAVATPAPAASAFARAEPVAPRPLDPKWKLPSAESIPPVSIMTAEPKLAKPLPEPAAKEAEQKADAAPPLPPKRPQEQATPAPQAR